MKYKIVGTYFSSSMKYLVAYHNEPSSKASETKKVGDIKDMSGYN
jgi:hypothetical protein